MTTTAEVVYIPDNVDVKASRGYQGFRLRVWIISGLSMLVVISVAVALIIQILNYSTFLSQNYDLAEGDMRIVSVSTAFCEEISLGEDASKRTLSILPSLKLGHKFRRTNTSSDVFVSKFHYWYKGFYLLEGSSILINAESDDALSLFIFKDKKRLNEWIDKNGNPPKVASGERPHETRSTTQPTKISYSLSALETGNYYILFKFSKGVKDFARMKLDLNINRKVYDLTPSVFRCTAEAQDTCSARLLFGSSEVGVIEVIDKLIQTSYRNNELITSWQCVPRTWFYLAVFAGPTLFAAIVSFAFYFFIVSRKKHFERLDERSLQSSSVAGRYNSLSYRSLDGSMRRPPSETPSTRSLGNQNDMLRAPFLQPVVTTMYTGDSLNASEDSGNDTDQGDKQSSVTSCVENGKCSVDGMSVDSREITVSRKPSFTTFQGREDGNVKIAPTKSRNTSERLRENTNPKYEKAITYCHELRSNSHVGSLPKNLPARRYSSDEIFDRRSKTLPHQHGCITMGVQVPYQHAHGVDDAVLGEDSQDSYRSRRSSSERLHRQKHDHCGMRGKNPRGVPIPVNSPTRRYSSDDLCDSEHITLLCNRDKVEATTHPPYQPSTNSESSMSRNSSERRHNFGERQQPYSKKTRKPNEELYDRQSGSVKLSRNHDSKEFVSNPPYQPTTSIEAAAMSHNLRERKGDVCQSGLSGSNKPYMSEARSSDRQEIGSKPPNGTIPNYSVRRCSSDELSESEIGDHTRVTLPRNRGYMLPSSLASDQVVPEKFLPYRRPFSLPYLQNPDGSKALRLHSAPNFCPKGSVASDEDTGFGSDKDAIEPQNVKLRKYSGRRREMGWTPRLSMVSESEL